MIPIEECFEVYTESYYIKTYNIMLQKSKLLEAQITNIDTTDTTSKFLLYYNTSIKLRVIEDLNTAERIIGYYLTEYGDISIAYLYWCKMLLRVNYYNWIVLDNKTLNLIESVTYILKILYNRRFRRDSND